VQIRFSVLASAALVAAASACTSSHHDVTCPRNQPAFRIQVTAADGPLPLDTQLRVAYSGIETESYSLAHGGPDNQDVCCRPGTPTNGALPDVRCGVAGSVAGSIDASVIEPTRDAATLREAATLRDSAPRMVTTPEAAVSLDGALAPPAEASGVPSRDAGMSRNPSAPDAATSRPDGSTGRGSNTEAILCDLWTNGVATVTITGSGYAKLDALLDDPFVPDPRCGVETVDHRLTLTHADGGILR